MVVMNNTEHRGRPNQVLFTSFCNEHSSCYLWDTYSLGLTELDGQLKLKGDAQVDNPHFVPLMVNIIEHRHPLLTGGSGLWGVSYAPF